MAVLYPGSSTYVNNFLHELAAEEATVEEPVSANPITGQVPGKFRQVQAARVEAGAAAVKDITPAAHAAPAARALTATAAGVAEVRAARLQRYHLAVLKPRDLAQRAARLQRYLSTVPAPLLQKGPALAQAIRRCPRAPLVRGSDS